METYEFRNDTCFLSVMLRNHVDYIIIPFLTYRMLRNLTNCATMHPFEFRHVTELHELPNDGCQVPKKWSNESCMPPSKGPRTKLGYDK